MNKSETMLKYWDCIKWTQKETGLSQRTVRKFYKHVKSAILDHIHAESERENIYAEDAWNNLRDMMQSYDQIYRKPIEKVIVQTIEDP